MAQGALACLEPTRCWDVQVDMQALVADVVELAGSLVRKDVEFLTSIQPVPRIAGDTGRVAQVRSLGYSG